MKLRNRLIALVCFLIFVAIGTAYFLNNVAQKPFAIILFIGDGMSPGVITATRLYKGGAEERLAIEEFPYSGLTRTAGKDFAVPDAASSATAIATGQRTNHETLGMDINSKPLISLLEDASAKDRSIGIVSNGSLTGETAAAFYAKSLRGYDKSENAKQLSEHSLISLLLGGGKKYFITPATLPDKNKTEKENPHPENPETNLLTKLQNKGYLIAKTIQELTAIPSWKSAPIIGLFSDDEFSFRDDLKASGDQPTLSQLVKESIERLQHSRHGYFLIVDDALLAKAAALNNGEHLLNEMIDFDNAIAIAKQYAGPNALIVVTGKQNIGGLSMNGYPFCNDKGVAVLGVNAQGCPSITWSTGPGYNTTNVSTDGNKESASILAEPSAFSTPSTLGVAEDTITMAKGPGAEQVHGFIDLTTIHDLIKKQL